MMLLVEFFFVGLFLPFTNSNYETSEKSCFCYDEPETDVPYSICKESVLPSGTVMYFLIREEPFEHKSICTYV